MPGVEVNESKLPINRNNISLHFNQLQMGQSTEFVNASTTKGWVRASVNESDSNIDLWQHSPVKLAFDRLNGSEWMYYKLYR